MKIEQAILTVAFVVGGATAVLAQSDTDNERTSANAGVHALDVISQRMEAYVNAMPTFEVTSNAKWTLDGGRQVGDCKAELKVRHPGAFHLRVGSEAVGGAWLECASDGSKLTRLYRTDELAIFSTQEGGLKQILDDAMTHSSVQGSGLELVTRPDFHAYLMGSVSEVQDRGQEELDGQKVHHFSATWYDGSQVDFWVAADREPLLLRWYKRRALNLGDDQPHHVEIDCRLSWKPNANLPAEFTRIAIPSSATEVKDLQHYLIEGGTRELLGKPAPDVRLTTLDGSTWELAKHRGSEIVVLFFFATWAAPSTNDMPTILRFVEEYESQGVVFYAISVGEDAETVRAFVEAQKYVKPVVLDPQRQATSAYRITSLPVTVMVGKQGTLQAVHVGTSPEERALIQADLKKLVDGQPLVEAQRD